MFQKLIPRLAISRKRVIAYNIREHDYTRGASLTELLEYLASDLKDLINILQVDRIDIVGASYGGTIA